MKNLLLYSALAAISFSLVSCDDEDNPQTVNPPTVYDNYAQLKTGNYWIYQHYLVDSLGNGSPLQEFDSCYVEKDTVINGNTFYKVIRPDDLTLEADVFYWRDSLSYLVTPEGKLVFSSEDFTTIFDSSYYVVNTNDTVTKITTKMADPNQSISVPAGTFNTINRKATYLMYNNWASAGTYRYRHTRYALNVGIVAETFPFFVSNPFYTERRLVRYHLAP